MPLADAVGGQFGHGADGEGGGLGNGDIYFHTTPIQVENTSDAVRVAAGMFDEYVSTSQGTVCA